MKTLTVACLISMTIASVASAQVVTMPSASEKHDLTPERAARLGVKGKAAVRCDVQADGSLKSCAVVMEAPTDYAFGLASIRAAQQYVRAKPPQDGGQSSVVIPFVWDSK